MTKAEIVERIGKAYSKVEELEANSKEFFHELRALREDLEELPSEESEIKEDD